MGDKDPKASVDIKKSPTLEEALFRLKQTANRVRCYARSDEDAFRRQDNALNDVSRLYDDRNVTTQDALQAIKGISEILRAQDKKNGDALAIDDTGPFKALLTEDVLKQLVELRTYFS